MTRIQNTSRGYGSIDIRPLETADLIPSTQPSRTLAVRHERYTYLPPPDLRTELPPGFTVTMDVYTGSDGMRRFFPAGDVGEFIAQAFMAGLALLSRDRGMTGEHRNSYRVMRFIRDRVLHMQEHLGREFSYSRDLYIRRPGRETDGERSVLPDHLGRGAAGSGRPWSPQILCEEGRARARSAGIERLTSRTAIAYGLLAAAERDPLHIRPEETAALIRGALFAPAEEEESITNERLAQVSERILVLFQTHLDDSSEEFNRWFSGGNSNLFSAIAGRELRVSVVRKAMLQLGWQAYQYVAGCINYFVQALVRTLPQRLTPDERELISQMYQPQRYLGDLPLILLLERRQLIAPLISRLWESPGDPETIAILHRILDYHASMAACRRAADVRSQQRERRLEVSQPDLVERNAIVSAPLAGESSYARILRRLVRVRELRCLQCGRPTACVLVGEGRLRAADGDVIRCEHSCPEHGSQGQIVVTVEEFRSIAEELCIEDPG